MYYGYQSPRQSPGMLGSIGGSILTGAEAVGTLLDAPANYLLRPILAGRLDRLGSGITPHEMLDEWGADSLLGDDNWGRYAADFAAGAVLDPLNLVSLGGKTAAGALAKAAGRYDDVARIAGRSKIDDLLRTVDDADDFRDAGSYARSSLGTYADAGKVRGIDTQPTGLVDTTLQNVFGQNPLPRLTDADAFRGSLNRITDNDLISRPLVGSRQAGRSTTLQDLVDDIGSQPFESALKKGESLDDLLGQTMTQDIGLRLPFSEQNLIGGNLPLRDWGSGMDRLGQILRWSGPGRFATAAFSRANRGQTDAVGQLFGQNISRAEKNADVAARGNFSDLTARLSNEDFADPNVRRAMETGDTTGLSPEAAEIVNEWRRPGGLREQAAGAREYYGLSNSVLEDEAVGYFPRYANPDVFNDDFARGAGRATDVSTPDRIARKDYLKNIEGGTDEINRLSRDPRFAGPNRTMGSDEEAAEAISQILRQPDGSNLDTNSALKVARTLYQMDEAMVRQGSQLFNNSWAKDLESYLRSNAKATAVANELTDIVATATTPTNYTRQSGHLGIEEVMNRLGMQTFDDTSGYAPRLEEALRRTGAANADDLSQFSLPREVAKNIEKLSEVSKSPHVLEEFFKKYADPLVNMWKGSILAWPARFTRDWFSGVAVNLVEVGSPMQAMKGYSSQKMLMDGDWDGLYRALVTDGKGTRYANTRNIDEFRQAVQRDLAQSGIIENKTALDLGEAINRQVEGDSIVSQYRAGSVRDATVGTNAVSGNSLLQDTAFQRRVLDPLRNNPRQFAEDFLQVGMPVFQSPKNVRNPFMQWSADLGNTTDFLNRGAGYFALVDEGVNPVEAGRRMLAGHVDYGQNTGVDQWIKRVIPFWTYTSRIGAWTAKKLGENPGGRYRQLMLPKTGDDDQFVPQQVRESYGAMLDNENGVQTWIQDFDLPGVDTLNQFVFQKDARGGSDIGSSVSNSLLNISNNMNPMLKAGVETATGIDTLTGRPWKTRKTGIQRLLEPVVGETAAGVAKPIDPILQMIPFVPRLTQLARRATDSERVPDVLNLDDGAMGVVKSRIPQILANLFTGVKVNPIDQAEVNRDQMRVITQLLDDDPMIRDFSTPYIPEYLRESGQVDPATEMLLELYGELSKERRALQEARQR